MKPLITDEPNGVTWGWLGKAVAGVVIAGIPTMLAIQATMLIAQSNRDSDQDKVTLIIKERQDRVIETLEANLTSLRAIEDRLTFFRSERDVGWQQLQKDILELKLKWRAEGRWTER